MVRYMQDFFRCEPGTEAVAERVTRRSCQKLVSDMIYEARKQAVIDYNAVKKKIKVTKKEACTMQLTREEYMEVIQRTLIVHITILWIFSYVIFFLPCRRCRTGVMRSAGGRSWTSG